MTSTGVYVKNLGDMFETSFTKHLKYNLHEADTFKDLFGMREQVYQAYLRADRALLDKKDGLFKKKDVTKWGGFKDNQQMVRMRDELLKEKDMAAEFMLPKESAEVESKKHEVLFFTNQCWDEIRRVSNDNGSLLFEHFRDMAQLHCSQIGSNAKTWEDFLTYFVEACSREKKVQDIEKKAFANEPFEPQGSSSGMNGGGDHQV
jgi:hypothetical protein